ncbi:MAG: L-threonylcarbamoyladenylate synthase [Burkholderiales bacterium]
MTGSVIPADDEGIALAVRLLRDGGLVGFPTETVYGLGADAANPAAVRRIFEAKGRPADHPVIVHVAEVRQLPDWARDVPPDAAALAEAFWPGPMTLILPRATHVSDLVTGGQDSVGLRIPSHPVALRLLAAFGGGVAGPSANRFGRISPTTAAHVREDLGERVDLILDGGPCRVGIESTIIDVTGARPRILRPGMISTARIEAVLRRSLDSGSTGAPRVSGSLASHYAPRTPTVLVPPERLSSEVTAVDAVLARPGKLSAVTAGLGIDSSDDPAIYARDLYAHLRTLDASGCPRILIEDVPAEGEWAAIRDRLVRAARH